MRKMDVWCKKNCVPMGPDKGRWNEFSGSCVVLGQLVALKFCTAHIPTLRATPHSSHLLFLSLSLSLSLSISKHLGVESESMLFVAEHELQHFEFSVNGGGGGGEWWVGEEGEKALHHNQVKGELDGGRARQVSRSSSTVSPLPSSSHHNFTSSFFTFIRHDYVWGCYRWLSSLFPFQLSSFSCLSLCMRKS